MITLADDALLRVSGARRRVLLEGSVVGIVATPVFPRVLRSGDVPHEFGEPGEPVSSGQRVEFDDVRAATTWLARFLADPSDAQCLRHLAGVLARGEPTHDDRDVLARIAAALVMRRLALIRVIPVAAPPVALIAEEKENEEAREKEREVFDRMMYRPRDDHWIEVQLLGEDGEGIPWQRCRIVTSDQRVLSGHTDGSGVVRWSRIAGGECRVCFPDLDAGAWEQLRTEGP